MNVLYYIQSGETGPVKIAATAHRTLDKRVADGQAFNPQPLLLRALYVADPNTESRQHGRHRQHHQGGEWFDPAVLRHLPTELEAVPYDQAAINRTAALHRMRARSAGATA